MEKVHRHVCNYMPRKPLTRRVRRRFFLGRLRAATSCLESLIIERHNSGRISKTDVHHLFKILIAQSHGPNPPSIQPFNHILRSVSSTSRKAAVLFSRFTHEVGAVSPNIDTYDILIGSCCLSGNLGLGLAFFGRIVRAGLRANVRTFSSIINELYGKNLANEAVRVLIHRMPEMDCIPSIYSCNLILKKLCDDYHFDLARELLHWMGTERCKGFCCPDVVSYSTIISGFCKIGRMDETFKLLVEMKNSRVAMDLVMYNTVIYGFCKVGWMDKAAQLLYEMKTSRILPNVVTYSTIIDGICKAGDVDEAILLLHDMRISGVTPNVVTYNAILNGFCKVGRISEAFEFFNEMKTDWVVPNVITYSTLINGFCKEGKIDEALKLLGEMRSARVVPNVVTYNTVVDGLCNLGRFDDALELIKEMQSNRVQPTVATYNPFLKGFFDMGNCSLALELLKRMRKDDNRDCEPSLISYSIAIDFFCKSGRMNDAFDLFIDMKAAAISPDMVVLRTLISGLRKSGMGDNSISFSW